MTRPVYFFQACPVCGRSLRIRVGLLGRQVFCGHCQGSFRASDPALAVRSRSGPVLRPLEPLVPTANRPSEERVDELLERAARRLAETGAGGAAR